LKKHIRIFAKKFPLNTAFEFLKHLTDPLYIINWGSLAILTFIVFAECSFLVGFFLPGNSLIFISGIICAAKPEILHTGLPFLILSLSFGAMFGYFIGYWFGRKQLGPKWLKEKTRVFFFKKKYVDHTIRFYDDHGGKTLVIGRFLPLVRTFAPIIGGMVQMHYRTFMFYNIAGALIWIGSLSCVGYYFGTNPWVQENIGYVIIALIIITIASLFVRTKRINRQ
jgi:membrane-associated protein